MQKICIEMYNELNKDGDQVCENNVGGMNKTEGGDKESILTSKDTPNLLLQIM